MERPAMIIVFMVIAVLVIVFTLPAMIAALENRSERSSGPDAGQEPRWWAQFERDFRAYARHQERAGRRPR